MIAVPPTIALTSAEATRLAELPEATRDRIYQWIASGDRLLVGEARRLLSPIAPPKPAPATLEELLGRLTEDPSHVPAAAAALCQAFEDHKSYSGYLARLTEAWHGERDVAELVGAYRQASGPRCRKPGAVFMHALKSDGS